MFLYSQGLPINILYNSGITKIKRKHIVHNYFYFKQTTFMKEFIILMGPRASHHLCSGSNSSNTLTLRALVCTQRWAAVNLCCQREVCYSPTIFHFPTNTPYPPPPPPLHSFSYKPPLMIMYLVLTPAATPPPMFIFR